MAAGGTLTTDIFILNGGTGSAPYILNFYDDNGQPLAAPLVRSRGHSPGRARLTSRRLARYRTRSRAGRSLT